MHGRIIIYSNFSWLTKIFQLVERMAEDMQARKKYLVDSLDRPVENFDKFIVTNADDEEKRRIRLNIINGFQFVQQLSKYADE